MADSQATQSPATHLPPGSSPRRASTFRRPSSVSWAGTPSLVPSPTGSRFDRNVPSPTGSRFDRNALDPLDLTSPIALSTISHWEHKSLRFTIFRLILTLSILLQSLYIPTLGPAASEIGILARIASVVITSLMCGSFLIIEWIGANRATMKPASYQTTLKRELITQTFIILLIGILHTYHQTGAKAVLNNILARGDCRACTTSTVTTGLLDIGRSYIEEIAATTLSIATVWCISPHMVFLRGKTFAAFWLFAKWICCAFVTWVGLNFFWSAFCASSGQRGAMCFGDTAVAAWALLWIPVGRRLGHIAPFMDLVGKEVLREYPGRYQG